MRRGAIAALIVPLLSACGSSPSAPAAATPVTSATVRANVGITSISVSSETRAVGLAYHVIAHLHESAGTAATIVAVDLTLTSGSTTLVTTHSDQPISDTAAANVCPGNGSVDTANLSSSTPIRRTPPRPASRRRSRSATARRPSPRRRRRPPCRRRLCSRRKCSRSPARSRMR